MIVRPTNSNAAASSQTAHDEPAREEVASAINLLNTLIGAPEQRKLFDAEQQPASQMIYTHGVTLWMLTLQRLSGGRSLAEVVSEIIAHDHELLPDNKRIRENTLSENSAAYSRARTRLPLTTVEAFSKRVANYLGQSSQPVINGKRIFILDGTTITLAPTKALQEAYPPATNQHGESVWPVALLMVANEMQSGCALFPEIAPMYGEKNASEAVLAERILKQLPDHSIVMADANFGIFSVAYHTVEAEHDFLFRLTKARFKSLHRQADLIDKGPTHKTYHLSWKPTSRDRKSTPSLSKDAAIEVLIHEVVLSSSVTLYLISTLEIDALSAADVYNRRYDVEFDIRDLKVTMDTENIRAKSVDMFKKELYASVVAYNLVVQFRRQAAELAEVKPRRLSFKGVWTTIKNRLLLQPACSLEEWHDRFAIALHHASKKKHPIRPELRSYPRKAHPRRQKTTKFEKALRKKKKAEDQAPPNPEPK